MFAIDVVLAGLMDARVLAESNVCVYFTDKHSQIGLPCPFNATERKISDFLVSFSIECGAWLLYEYKLNYRKCRWHMKICVYSVYSALFTQTK